MLEALESPHESRNCCSVAENLRSNLRHNCRSCSVTLKSAGNGSITGRGAGRYGAGCGAAQAVSASKHAALSSFEVRCIVLFLSVGVSILGCHLGAQVRLDFVGGRGVAVVLLFAGGDGAGPAGLVSEGTVMDYGTPAGEQRGRGQDATEQQAIERAHGRTWS